MPATDDRWDVTVVGLRDPSHASAVMVVAELAHYASLPPQEVERMLDEGEVSVLTNLDRAEAERAAHELNELGAVIDLRLTDASSGVFPVLKPDADRQVGVAVGGLIDDSATPPTVGESFGGLPELEPDLEVPQRPRARTPSPERNDGLSVTLGSGVHRMPTGQHRPAIMRGQGPDPLEASPYVEPAPRHELLTDRGPPGLGDEPIPAPRPGERRPGEYGLHRNDDPRGARPAARAPGHGGPGHGAPGHGGPGHGVAGHGGGSRGRTQTPRPQAASTGGRPAAAKPKRKKSRPNMESLLGDIGPSAPPESPKLPQRLERATAAAKKPAGPLELDFEAAGMQRPPPRGGVPAPVHQADHSASAMPRRSRTAMGGTGASAAGYSGGEGGLVEMLRSDGVAGLILGLGVGLILSMVLALQLQRGDVRERLPPLEDELAASLNDSAAVEAGEMRAPDAVEGEINQTLDEIERKFLLWWLGVGLPIGVLLSRLRAL